MGAITLDRTRGSRKPWDFALAVYFRQILILSMLAWLVGAFISGFESLYVVGMATSGLSLIPISLLGYWAFRKGMHRAALAVAVLVAAALFLMVSSIPGVTAPTGVLY